MKDSATPEIHTSSYGLSENSRAPTDSSCSRRSSMLSRRRVRSPWFAAMSALYLTPVQQRDQTGPAIEPTYNRCIQAVVRLLDLPLIQGRTRHGGDDVRC